eukprot:m.387983 g.387983  ORF g.387983 m.387983 type:complete len:59 (-) comp165358_c0_seq1:11-187(-)
MVSYLTFNNMTVISFEVPLSIVMFPVAQHHLFIFLSLPYQITCLILVPGSPCTVVGNE